MVVRHKAGREEMKMPTGPGVPVIMLVVCVPPKTTEMLTFHNFNFNVVKG